MNIPSLSIVAALRADTTGYRLLLLGHLLCVIVGFGSTFVYPFLGAQSAKRKGVEGAAISDAVLATGKIVTGPFIYGALVFGLLVVALGDTYDWSDRFVQFAIPILVGAIAFQHFVSAPNIEAMNRLAAELATMGPPLGDEPTGPPPQVVELERRGKAAARNGGFLHVAFAIVLVLMVWKPL